jgi:hypothetical protein
MAIMTLDDTTALVVIDLQKGLLAFARIGETGTCADVPALLAARGA